MGGHHNPTTILLALALALTPAVGAIASQATAPSQADLRQPVEDAVHAAIAEEISPAAAAHASYEAAGPPGALAQANLDTVVAATDGASAPASADAAELLASLGVDDPDAAAANIDEAPPALASAIVELLAAFQDHREEAREAFGDADRRADARTVAQAAGSGSSTPVEAELPGLDAVLESRQRLVAATAALERSAQAHGAVDVQIEECPTLHVDLTHADDTHEEDCALLVDAGGEDTYLNNAGGTNVGASECGIVDYETHRFTAAAIDLGEASDAYGSAEDPASCGVNGGGWGGTGLLWDEGGADAYHAGSTATNGGALYGLGFLHDGGGDDLYTAGGYATNGGAAGGVGLVHDEAGNDTYRATTVATNGGSYSGVGLVYDENGDDTYEAGAKGSNGGTIRGVASLIDDSGDDTYRATHTGANGHAVRELTGFLSVIIPPSAGLGLLLDGEGQDFYRDLQDGTGPDESKFHKGTVGFQVDLPHLPNDAQDQRLDREAPNATPHVTVGIPDTDINPYHERFHRPNLTEHPCTYIPDFPCDVQALNLTLNASSREEALEADKDVWESVEPGEWYWIPQTSFVAVACEPDQSGNCIINDESWPSSHGTSMASSVVSENEDALLAYKHGGPSLDMFLNRGLPVDVYTVSKAHDNVPKPLPADTCGAWAEHETVGLYVKSTNDLGAYSTVADCWDGAPNVVEVGGAQAEDRSTTLTSSGQPELVSYFCRPVAHPENVTGTVTSSCGGGSSISPRYSTSHTAGPTAAGAISKVVQAVREETGYTGNVEEGVVDPLYGDDGLTVGELRDAVNRTASYDPEPKYDTTSNSAFMQPRTPVAPWTQWGWGFYDGWVANATVDHLLTQEQPAKPLPVQLYMQGQETVTSTYYGDPR